MSKERTPKKTIGNEESSGEEYWKQLPPPKENANELKMEQCLKRLIEEREKKR